MFQHPKAEAIISQQLRLMMISGQVVRALVTSNVLLRTSYILTTSMHPRSTVLHKVQTIYYIVRKLKNVSSK